MRTFRGSVGQSGLDLIATYGWVVLVAIGGSLVLSQMGTFNPSQCGKSFLGFSQVVPVDWTVYIGTDLMIVSVQVDNWAGNDVEVDNLSASFEDLSCSGIANTVLEPGNKSTFTLNCTGSKDKSYHHGDCYNVHLDINYHNLASGNFDDSQGKIRGVFEEFVATTSTTTSTTLASTTTTTSTTTTLCALDSQCPFCQKCVSGFCANEGTIEDTKNECPGAFGSCAGAFCNGAGACQYLVAGKGGCGACQYCTGSSFSCASVGAGSDTYNDCPGAFGACAGANCNGAGACQYLAAGKQGCGTCQYCTGAGFACSNMAAGSDTYGDCPGAFGACADTNCNGAGACQYLSGEQSCGVCQTCTGSGFACSIVPLGQDPNNDCAANWNGCSGSCVKTGTDGNCNGAGACNAGGASANCSSNTTCSAGSCVYSGSCGSSGVYCSTHYRFQDSYRCDGGGVCSFVSSSTNLQDCGTDYWGSNYQCSGQQPQRQYFTIGCSSGSCTNVSSWQNNGSACTGGENSRCVGGSCVNQCSNGLDDDGDGYIDGQDTDCGGCGQCTSGACCNTANGCFLSGKQSCGTCQLCTGASSSCSFIGAGSDPNNECPGAFGTCAGANCNGAGACQYLAAGKQGCGTCQGCTGSSFACAQVAAGSDTYNECPGAFGTCAGANCNGASACQYLAVGKQGCSTCQYCTGSGFACSNVAAVSDPYGDCPGAFGTCADTNCNGAGACSYLAAGKQSCGTCQGCTGSGFACAQVAAGSDTYNECPGAFGTCAGANCNGASACQYLAAGKQGCSTCQYCTGSGFACSNVAAVSDPYGDCPGAFGTCADTNCNGAGACSYLAAGQQTCGACKYCTGAGFACANVGAGTDPYNACTASYNGCANICVKSGPDGNCDGSGSCNAAGLSTNVAVNNYCSAGSEVAGVCNAVYACTNAQSTNGAYNNAASPFWTQAYCTGAGACTRSGTTSDADLSTGACTCRQGATRWAIGGEVDAAGCCGDEAGEYKLTRVCTSGCVTSAADDACCNANNKCVYSSACYANGACYTNLICNAGSWVSHCSNGVKDCDETGTDCGGSCGSCPVCWNGANKYLYQHGSNQLQKFCKCATGTYGATIYVWDCNVRQPTYKYTDTNDNYNWGTASDATTDLCTWISVTCSNSVTYSLSNSYTQK